MNLRSNVSQPLFSAVIALGCAGALSGIETTIRPNIAQAYTARVDVALDRLPNETYDALVRRAELVARAAAQRSFDRDILASEVSVIITGRHRGFEAPILSLNASRTQWRDRPDAKRWATYYRTAAGLLGFSPAASVAPTPAPQAQPAKQTLIPAPPDTPLPPVTVPSVPPSN